LDEVTVVDVEHGQLLPAQRVVIVGNRIQAVGAALTVSIPGGAQVIDARGQYLLPGLWDMHSHWGDTLDLVRLLFNGVTGVASMSVEPNQGREWRQEILAGTRVGPPRQTYAYNAVTALWAKEQDPSEMGPQLESAKTSGLDMVKTNEMISKERYFTFAAEARRIGMPFGGHLEDADGMSALDASDSGASVVDHMTRTAGGLDTLCVHNTQSKYRTATLTTCRQAADRLRRNGTWWAITIVDLGTGATAQSPLMPSARSLRIQAAVDARATQCRQGLPGPGNWLRDSARFDLPGAPPDSSGILSLVYRAGMPILAGTDRSAHTIHAELALMVAEGVPPLAALQAATLKPAIFLHATDSLGTVAPGKLADLLLVDADPLADITNTTMIRAVIANGRYYDRKALDELAAAARNDSGQYLC